MKLRQTGARTSLQVIEHNMAEKDAAVVLAGIAAGSIARCLLPWIPLMQKADEPAIIAQWLELAQQEPDTGRRGDYGGLAVVFAEAAGRKPMWKQALEGWNVKESEQVLEWMAEGKAEGKAEGLIEGEMNALLRTLKGRFPPGPAAELIAAIRACRNLGELQRWSELAIRADSLESFRSAAGL